MHDAREFGPLQAPEASKEPTKYGSAQLATSSPVSISGPYLVAISTAAFALASVLLKMDVTSSGSNFPTTEIGLVRSIVSLAVATMALCGRHDERLSLVLRPSGLQVLRGIMDCASFNCFYFACTQLPVGVATVIMFTNPFWAGILARLVLKEAYGLWQFGATALAVGGVLLTVWPQVSNDGTVELSNTGIVFAALASLFQACQYVTGRAALESGLSYLQVSITSSVVGILLSIPLIVFCKQQHIVDQEFVPLLDWNLSVWCVTMAIACAATTAQLTLLMGQESVGALKTSMLRTLDIPMAMLWAYLLLGEVPYALEVIGASIVIAAVFLQTLAM
eukprot:gb/GFBE01017704.1/.p1 GENE.gb/GFBE01017704.1/~~gb/GFBE01017704.1/.p1  ORF type:complete len:335 (+),score=41.28 gb/GFBE01017704.1/:1-1005(+)